MTTRTAPIGRSEQDKVSEDRKAKQSREPANERYEERFRLFQIGANDCSFVSSLYCLLRSRNDQGLECVSKATQKRNKIMP